MFISNLYFSSINDLIIVFTDNYTRYHGYLSKLTELIFNLDPPIYSTRKNKIMEKKKLSYWEYFNFYDQRSNVVKFKVKHMYLIRL